MRTFLFDTNAVINFISDKGDFSQLTDNDKYYLSFISKIELYTGFKTREEEIVTHLFVEKADLVLINNKIIDQAIEIRKETGLKLPDSVIAATAIENNAILITSDVQMIKKLSANDVEIFDPLS